MNVRKKMAAIPKRAPFRSEKVVVGEWESRAKYPEIGRDPEYLRVFKFEDGTGCVFLVKEETGEIRTMYPDTLPFEHDEICGFISPYDFHVVEVKEFHLAAGRDIEEQFRVERNTGSSPVYHYVFVYSDGTGAVADLDAEDHMVVSPPREVRPLDSLEGYFDVERWKVTRIK